MKTIPKSQYLLLKMKENYETNLKNQTVEITDEEYDNLIQYNTINIDEDNNLEDARLICLRDIKYCYIIHNDAENINIFHENINEVFSFYFYVVFDSGTYYKVQNGQITFKLKENIGKLIIDYNNGYDNSSSYPFRQLNYICPNNIDKYIQETIIASYKGLTCEFCDINIYKTDYSLTNEYITIRYSGDVPNNIYNYIKFNDPNLNLSYNAKLYLEIMNDNITIRINDNDNYYYELHVLYYIKNNEIFLVDAHDSFMNINDNSIIIKNFAIDDYHFEGDIEFNNDISHVNLTKQ